MNQYIETFKFEKSSIWKVPVICPQPEPWEDVKTPCVSLNSDHGIQWKFSMEKFQEELVTCNDYDYSGWNDITVPGNVLMQGFDIQNDIQYFYKARINVPKEYDGNRIILRFHGVYSVAKVWVNRIFIRSHIGGFTTWDCDITDTVRTGEEAIITVSFVDVLNDVSIASKYAHFNIGGINRSVELVCIPNNHITGLHYETYFDENYNNATLKLMIGTHLSSIETAQIKIILKDHLGNQIPLEKDTILATSQMPYFYVQIPVESPNHWDSEHPYLYELTTTLFIEHKEIETVKTSVGFREITYGGKKGTDLNKIYVNGQPIKLRGTCRHDVHPQLGRSTTPELDEKDVITMRNANMNYIRTSHYPPTKEFLDLCDKYGIYVEEENAICFQDIHAGVENYQKNRSEWYVGQFSEMVERDRIHPCVIIWSLGNESQWHRGFQEEYDYIKETDVSRPAKFSYPEKEPLDDTTPCYDIFSMHYVEFDGEMSLSDRPTIHDEYVHIACYNHHEINRDTNVRNILGESLYKAWENIIKSDGALGGAIWAATDDVFFIPENTHETHQLHSNGYAAGYGEWGNCTDIWLTKKAYSPIRIKDGILPLQTPNTNIHIPISNWFNHTNFNEVEFHWSIDNASGAVDGMNLSPYKEGILIIPYTDWNENSVLKLAAFLKSNLTYAIDSYILRIKECFVELDTSITNDSLKFIDEDTFVKFFNNKFSVVFDRYSGMLKEAAFENQVLLTGGPHIILQGIYLQEWKLKENGFSYKITPDKVVISIEGNYGEEVPIKYVIELYGDGRIDISYSSERQFSNLIRNGIYFDIPLEVESVSWSRKGLYTDYPANHIGRPTGTAAKERSNCLTQPDSYGDSPNWDWKDDMKNFYMNTGDSNEDGIVTNDFNALRENIYEYSVAFENLQQKITIHSSATDSAKVDINYVDDLKIDDTNKAICYSDNHWESVFDTLCFNGTYHRSNTPEAYMEYEFMGDGINVIGRKNETLGSYKVFLDEIYQGEYSESCTIELSQRVIFSVKDLPYGKHVIKIVVSGSGKENQWVVIDGLQVLDQNKKASYEAKLIILKEWAYQSLAWGNYVKQLISIPSHSIKTVHIKIQ